MVMDNAAAGLFEDADVEVDVDVAVAVRFRWRKRETYGDPTAASNMRKRADWYALWMRGDGAKG